MAVREFIQNVHDGCVQALFQNEQVRARLATLGATGGRLEWFVQRVDRGGRVLSHDSFAMIEIRVVDGRREHRLCSVTTDDASHEAWDWSTSVDCFCWLNEQPGTPLTQQVLSPTSSSSSSSSMTTDSRRSVLVLGSIHWDPYAEVRDPTLDDKTRVGKLELITHAVSLVSALCCCC